MGNKKNILRYSHIATLFLVGLAVASGIWIYLSLSSSAEQSSNETLPKIEVNQELYQKIKSDTSYGTKVSADEPGFGRVNPFSNYKAETVELEEEVGAEATTSETEEE